MGTSGWNSFNDVLIDGCKYAQESSNYKQDYQKLSSKERKKETFFKKIYQRIRDTKHVRGGTSKACNLRSK